MSKLHKTKEKEVFYYFLKSGKKRFMYRHLYYDLLGKRRERKKSGFKSLEEAQRELIKLKASMLDNNQLQTDKHDLNVSQWIDIWYQTYSSDWAVSTREARKNTIEKHIKRLIGNIKLKDITKTIYINRFLNVLKEEGFKPHSTNSMHATISTALNAAVEDDILDRNRIRSAPIEKPKRLTNFLTPYELNIFLRYAKRERISDYTLISLLAYTGMRSGEALGMHWSDIDFKGNTVSIKRTRDVLGTRKPKTDNSIRTIKVDGLVFQQLKKYRAWCMQRKLECGEQLADDDYIFLNNDGSMYYYKELLSIAIRRIYRNIKKEKIKINTITGHGLRHTHCTILLSEGNQVKTVADRLGNTPETIFETYSHSFEELEEQAVHSFSQSLQSVAESVAEK
ncbi:MAG TPA: site-specific integrase [Bacillota bacterium]